MPRVAIYARYSSDLQRLTSIEDQQRICRERAAREGWQIIDEYSDAAISGSTLLDRPGVQNLLRDAKAGRFDLVLAEALDRLSRDQEHIAGLYKRLKYAGVRIVTLSEGEIDPLHIGFKGTMNELFLRDMAAKVRRGQRGQVERGRSAGGLSYGYRVVRKFGDDGKPVAGLREIDPDQAAVIRRIFQDYVAGIGPRRIARQLNAEGITSPSGRAWVASAINGSAARCNGILHNELYNGRITYNRQSFRKDPDTGKRIPVVNPREQWTIIQAPELRIVDDALWNAAQDLRRIIVRAPATQKQRPKHLLSGLLRCGVCGGSMVKGSTHYLTCSRRKESGTCSNHRRVRAALLEDRILEGIRRHLLAPEAIAAFIDQYRKEMAARNAGAAQRRADLQRKVDRATARIKSIIAAIADQLDTPDMRQEMRALTGDRDALQAALDAEDRPAVISLHPHAADVYRTRIADLQAVLDDPEARAEIGALLRTITAEIRLTPVADDIEVALTGQLAALFGQGQEVAVAQPFKLGNVMVAPA